jgi:nucleotide-binding universal stress UspA family protein
LRAQKILVAVDGSSQSMVAAETAIDLAEKFGAELIVLHVVSSDLTDLRNSYLNYSLTPGLPVPLKEVITLATEKGQNYLDEVKQKAVARTKLQIKTDILIGGDSVIKEIVEYCETHKVDLLVVGTRGMSGIKKMLLGSTASGLVTYAHCPILVVK